MKILAIGDFHGKFPQKLKKIAKECDVILSTGDFGGSDELLKIIFKHLGKDWTQEVSKKKANQLVSEDYLSGKKMINDLNKLKKPVYTIHGNWDFEGRRDKQRYGHLKIINYSKLIEKMKHVTFLKRGQFRKLDDLDLFAYGGMLMPYISTVKSKAFNKKKVPKNKKKEQKEYDRIMSKGRKGIDIFLAHYTPYLYFDQVKFKGYNPMNGKHVGIRAYTSFIKKYQPRVFVCGHMHEYQGLKKVGKTLIVATGAAKEGKAAVIDISKDPRKKIKVKFIK